MHRRSTPPAVAEAGKPADRGELDRLTRATLVSLAGLADAYRHESAFRREVWFAAVMLPGAFWLGRTWIETALLAASALLVLIAELFNSAIEAVVDRISPEWHALSKRAKDVASAAVLLAIILCVGVWCAAFWQRFGP